MPLIGASAALALFAILCGAQNGAIRFALAAESVVKLVVLLPVAELAGVAVDHAPRRNRGRGCRYFAAASRRRGRTVI